MPIRPAALLGACCLLLTVLAGTSLSPVAAAPPTARYIVTFHDGVDLDAAVSGMRKGGAKVERVFRHVIDGAVVDLTRSEVNALRRHPAVALIEADLAVTTAGGTQTNPPWGLDRIDQRDRPLDGTYRYPATAAGVRVYVVDTGVLASHVDLAGRVTGGYTSINDGLGTTDCAGHGTHVAATAAGTTWGVAKAATVVPVRVLNCSGSGTISGVIAGLDWIVANHVVGGPGVVNMSLGGGASSTLDNAVNRVIAAGLPVVVAAGNDNKNACNYSPARVPDAITVGATTSTDARASYSNTGGCLDLFAPGSSVRSAWYTSDTATATLSGTSMASPHVAGAVAVLLAQAQPLTPTEVAASIVAAATPNKVSSAGSGSPNLLLYSDPQPAPDPDPDPDPEPDPEPDPDPDPLVVTTTDLPSATTGVPYSVTLAATGGAGSHTWTMADGVLPSGLNLSTAGLISGTPTVSGITSFTVRVEDGLSATATQALAIQVEQAVEPPPGAFNKSRPADGAVNQSRKPKFTWGKSSNLTAYEICISSTPDCGTASTGWIGTGNRTAYTSPQLNPLTTYYWQVRAVNPGGVTEANGGAWWRFTTKR